MEGRARCMAVGKQPPEHCGPGRNLDRSSRALAQDRCIVGHVADCSGLEAAAGRLHDMAHEDGAEARCSDYMHDAGEASHQSAVAGRGMVC